MASQQDANSEPSIEEILDSIRQIISDDEEEGGEGAPPPAAEAPKAAEPVAAQGDDVIELTERVEETPPAAPEKSKAEPAQEKAKEPEPAASPPEPPINVDMQEPAPAAAPPPPPKPEPPKAMTPPPPPADNGDSILTKAAEDATMEAFSELAQRAAVEKGGTVTIEDVVRYEIRPLLRAWIDKHLPGIVERLVQKELEKISRRVDQD